ncbi:MAG TPA: hypothetical protein PKH79_10715 [Prolixibacteraceae bacterium]|nr:hypothetical protein [Prolixibacteraceae bacterium]
MRLIFGLKNTILFFGFLILTLFAHCQKENEIQTIAPMTVKNYEGHIHIGFWGDDNNMQISFYPCGVNQLFAIAKVYYYSTLADHKQEHASNEFSSCTDWVGPYYVCSATSVNAGLPQQFTGGWHGSNGDGTGSPTASTSATRFEVDGKEVNGNFELNCNQVDLYATNLIHGYDYSKTNANLLKESVHYTIKPSRQIDVEVRIEALDDAVIQRYYGLQSQNFSIFDQVSYLAGQQVINTAPIKADSNCKTNEGVNTILLTGNKTQHQLRVVLNVAEGLGVPGNLGDGKPKAFSASYGKSYFNLVNGKDLPLKKGEQVFWKGSYFWDE